jgi:hypothetical protein
MECGHGSKTGLKPCRMSCCHDQDHPLTGAVIFVLPDRMMIAAAVEVTAAELETQAHAMVHLFKPPSPPPRSYSLTA